MRKTLLYILSIILLQSCSWFDVGAESEIDEKDMFVNADGYYTALTGIYISMGSTELYGGNLTLTALEPLSQQYNVKEDDPDRIAWSQFRYTTDGGQELVSAIWLKMYNTIVNANMLLAKLPEAEGKIDSDVIDIIHGEALALRSLMYFDLMRMFNESYEVNPESGNVRFKTDFGFVLGKKMSNEQLIDTIISDLMQARDYLKKDPLYCNKAYSNRYLAYDRTQRMNYYAATALLARMEIYRGHYAEAAQYAEEVIDSEKYRFILPEEILETDIYGVEQKADRIFMPEMIFALYCENILTVSRSYYEGLTGDFAKSANAYEDNDVRRAWLYQNPSANGKINMIRYQRSVKLEDAGKYGDPVVPMLKISEMYLILAECNLNGIETRENALSLLNTIKQKRGEAALPATATTQTLWNELTHEYICDFRGEGQLFYYYKRRNLRAIDDGNYNGNTVSVPASAYVLPLPDYEKQFGY